MVLNGRLLLFCFFAPITLQLTELAGYCSVLGAGIPRSDNGARARGLPGARSRPWAVGTDTERMKNYVLRVLPLL